MKQGDEMNARRIASGLAATGIIGGALVGFTAPAQAHTGHGPWTPPTPVPTGTVLIIGTPERDVLQGADTADALFGLRGNDTLFGGAGNDYLFGMLGNDRLFGGPGADVIRGGKGFDVCFGDAADEFLSCERAYIV